MPVLTWQIDRSLSMPPQPTHKPFSALGNRGASPMSRVLVPSVKVNCVFLPMILQTVR